MFAIAKKIQSRKISMAIEVMNFCKDVFNHNNLSAQFPDIFANFFECKQTAVCSMLYSVCCMLFCFFYSNHLRKLVIDRDPPRFADPTTFTEEGMETIACDLNPDQQLTLRRVSHTLVLLSQHHSSSLRNTRYMEAGLGIRETV